MILFEWRALLSASADQDVTGFVLRITEAEKQALLSRYTPGNPVDASDAVAFFTELMLCLDANKDIPAQEG
jgi:hypothetical protein